MFETPYQELIYKKSYARWIEKEGRRENWDETVLRYRDFFIERVPKKDRKAFWNACASVRRLEIMPSMRALWTAGPALDRDNICGYNCAYLVVDNPKAFAELMYILLNGTGVGYSVERQFINKLPPVPDKLKLSSEVIVFSDSKRGWAEGYHKFILELYRGKMCGYDLSKIRPYGARLKTFGGRASGPGPLEELLEFTRRIFQNAKGRNLNSLECHDICCHVASVVVSGGVRRSACISLSNLSDDRMAKCKSGDFTNIAPYRQFANNSVAYTEKPDTRKIISEWIKLIESNSGERGIFNRVAADMTVAASGRREVGYEWGCNPCGEIILRPNQFCNLTEVVVRPEDTYKNLEQKVKYATILGCVQSTLTDFKFISKKWQDNCEEERLLGVSLTGLRDHVVLGREDCSVILRQLKAIAIDTAQRWARILNINVPTAITTVKPSGTVSQLVNSASGLHSRFAPYYIRRIQISDSDPIHKLLTNERMKSTYVLGSDNTVVYEFPMKSPEGSIVTADVSAIHQLNYWRALKENWCEHNPSCTITVKEDEWIEVLNWVNKNWDAVCGLSFYPASAAVYTQPVYEEINEETYNTMVESMPVIDFTKLSEYEADDQTEGSQEYSCTSGQDSCEV
jgi:ribonucleoside-triphosphate reductase